MRYLTKSQKKYLYNICSWAKQNFHFVPPYRNKIPNKWLYSLKYGSRGSYCDTVEFLTRTGLKTMPSVGQTVVFHQIYRGVKSHHLWPEGQADVQPVHVKNATDPVQCVLRAVLQNCLAFFAACRQVLQVVFLQVAHNSVADLPEIPDIWKLINTSKEFWEVFMKPVFL